MLEETGYRVSVHEFLGSMSYAAEGKIKIVQFWLMRAIGSQATVEADIQSHCPQPNDIYLLASDGLTHEVDDKEISEILAEIPKPPTKAALTTACEALITKANRNGGNDNITVLIVAVTPELAPA